MRVAAANPSQLPAEDTTPASKVLGDENLIGEILHRVDSPTTLVRAALISKPWLRRASDRAFLRRFRQCHPPGLLGFYVSGDLMPHPEFVPMPPNTELSAALRRAGSVFDALPTSPYSSIVWDSRNGRVLLRRGRRRFAVRDPLRHPRGATVEFPPPPSSPLPWRSCAMLLPDDDGDDATCYHVGIHHDGRSVSAKVTVLRSGAWTVLCSARADLATAPERIAEITLLAGGRIYTVAEAGYIIGVDLATADLFAIELPEGVSYEYSDYEYYDNLVPVRGDDSVLYLFHVKGDRLNVWLRRMHGHRGAGEWVLRDTISVKEACRGVIKMQESQPGNGRSKPFPVFVVGVGDNAEFVFLEVGCSGIIVHLHIRSRRAEKVYQRDPENDDMIEVHPFSMVWPPVFPALAPPDE